MISERYATSLDIVLLLFNLCTKLLLLFYVDYFNIIKVYLLMLQVNLIIYIITLFKMYFS